MCLNYPIELNNISVFQEDKQILSNVNLKIDRGEFVLLIGKVGSGKTSLIKTLYSDLALKEGYANVAGFDLHNISKEDIPFLRRKLGIVFQDFQLLSDKNIHDNLKLVLRATGWYNKEDISARIKHVLSLVKLPEKEFDMPNQLSGGEQQRIVIARALLNMPELILADEPTGNLDPETGIEIMEIFKKICENGRSVFMATHNYSFIEKYATRVIRLENGKLIEEV